MCCDIKSLSIAGGVKIRQEEAQNTSNRQKTHIKVRKKVQGSWVQSQQIPQPRRIRSRPVFPHLHQLPLGRTSRRVTPHPQLLANSALGFTGCPGAPQSLAAPKCQNPAHFESAPHTEPILPFLGATSLLVFLGAILSAHDVQWLNVLWTPWVAECTRGGRRRASCNASVSISLV